jgi:hypothetical protein
MLVFRFKFFIAVVISFLLDSSIELPQRCKERRERLESFINPAKRLFTHEFPIELLQRNKERMESLVSLCNEEERLFTPES